MFKKKLEWPTRKIRYKHKESRGLQLREYKHLGELGKRRNPSWVYSLTRGMFISKITRKKDGVCYVPISELEVGEILYLCLDYEYYLLVPVKVEDYHAEFLIHCCSKKEFAADSKKLDLELFRQCLALTYKIQYNLK